MYIFFQKKEKQKQKEAIVTELLGEVIMFLLSLSKNRYLLKDFPSKAILTFEVFGLFI